MWDILYRDRNFVAINKPAGVSVHQEEGAVNLLHSLAQQLDVERLWLVHRLDKPTSGVLLCALDANSASELAQQFADKTILKTYVALTDRKPSKKQGWIKGGMEKSRRGAWKLTRSDQNVAVTHFRSHVLAPCMRLFVLQPQTGKTHQLRVAMKSLSTPLLGDQQYGGTPAVRMFLHAWRLIFDFRGEHFVITAPLGAEWPSEKMAVFLNDVL